MLYLMNQCAHESCMDKFDQCAMVLNQFMQEHFIDGLEIMFDEKMSINQLPKEKVYGVHMAFWPIWLDFWKGDHERLMKEFENWDNVKSYYGGEHPQALIDWHRKELLAAEAVGAKYVVFHVSHVSLEHCYTYRFDYTDHDVFDAFAEMINAVFEGYEGSIELLLENQWWPGLKLDNRNSARYLLDKIHYPNIGFMLDIGHMMNNEISLKTEEEGVRYIEKVLDNLGEMASLIRGVHLNSSLSGSYVEGCLKSIVDHDHNGSFYDRYANAYKHIVQIDQHKPFQHQSIRSLIDRIRPAYLVHECIAVNYEEHKRFMELQNKGLSRYRK